MRKDKAKGEPGERLIQAAYRLHSAEVCVSRLLRDDYPKGTIVRFAEQTGPRRTCEGVVIEHRGMELLVYDLTRDGKFTITAKDMVEVVKKEMRSDEHGDLR